MKPTLAQLQERDLELEARRCAEAEGVTVDEMFSRKRTDACAQARRRFYRLLVEQEGLSAYSIARFVGRDHGTVLYALGLTSLARSRALAREKGPS